jgi:predicted nucleotidyltransferase
MPSIADIDEHIRSEIESRLGSIEAQQGVRYLFVVESGSRAWGFPSPDSDYDVRFVYVRPLDWYLSIETGRDVIETPLVDEIDLNGWDVRKTIGLLLKSNVIVGEWLESPIRYRADDSAVPAFRELADGLFDPPGAARHYASVGQTAAERWMAGSQPVPVKKYFYALRPALALRAMRVLGKQRPPMNLQQLQSVCDLPQALNRIIDELVTLKSVTNEKGNAQRYAELDEFIAAELALGAAQKASSPSRSRVEQADRFFRALVADEA